MTATETGLRVLIVDDNRDGADTLGMLVEELGNQVHVTYGGAQALDVAAAFRPDLILVDLVMPEMSGCDLVTRLRKISALAHTKFVAITGQKGDQHKALALQAGCDLVLFKPVTLSSVKMVLSNVAPTMVTAPQTRIVAKERVSLGDEPRLPIDVARRLRNDRPSRALTQAECEAALCDGIIRFQDEYLGWKSEQVQVHCVKDLFVVRIRGVLTLAERQLIKSSPDKGRDLIKQARKQLLELARPMLASLVHEAARVKVSSMHHDISTVTGEEVVLFSLVSTPSFQ